MLHIVGSKMFPFKHFLISAVRLNYGLDKNLIGECQFNTSITGSPENMYSCLEQKKR